MPNTTTSNLLIKAFTYAARGHEGELKKLTKTNYLYHPMAVAALVFKFGGDEKQAAAALLHDLINEKEKPSMVEQFGEEVTSIAFSFMDPPGLENKSWKEKKLAYLEKISGVSSYAFLVIACEEYHDGSELVYELKTHGPTIWTRYHPARADEVLWYYIEIFNLISKKMGEESSLSQEFYWIISELQVMVESL